jgi:hypothetical protein
VGKRVPEWRAVIMQQKWLWWFVLLLLFRHCSHVLSFPRAGENHRAETSHKSTKISHEQRVARER